MYKSDKCGVFSDLFSYYAFDGENKSQIAFVHISAQHSQCHTGFYIYPLLVTHKDSTTITLAVCFSVFSVFILVLAAIIVLLIRRTKQVFLLVKKVSYSV